MPIYEYVCPTCGAKQERNRDVVARDVGPSCLETSECDPTKMMLRKWGISGVIIR